MSTEKKRALKWLGGFASALALLCVGWAGKTLVEHGNAIAAQKQWNETRPAALEAAIAAHEREVLQEMNRRFDEIKTILLQHVSKSP